MDSQNIHTISQQSVCQFIEDEHTSGALLLTGEWGSGKTHFLKQVANEYNQEKYAVVHISLFGRSSAQEIEQDIKKELCYILASANLTDIPEETEDTNNTGDSSQNSNKLRKKLNEKGTVNKLVKGLGVITEHFKDDSKIMSGINSLVNFNYWDFIDLNKEILGRKVVIIFDDFERCTIKLDFLLGIINEYSENIGMKVIIVANDDKINDPIKFKEYKEKVVYKAIKLEQNINYVLMAFINEFDSKSSEYQRYFVAKIKKLLRTRSTG